MACLQVKCDRALLDNLCTLIGPSVVTVTEFDHRNYKMEFVTGFIVHSNETRTLVCVHKSVIEDRKWKSLFVHFNDGATERARLFVKKKVANFLVLRTVSTGGVPRNAVSFSECAPKREDVVTISEIDGTYPGLNFMTGTIW